jgi:3-oxoadipate enol-lactonase
MHVEDAGAGTPVLAVHGLGGSAHFFADFSTLMRPHCRVIAVDLPGTGRSVAPDTPPGSSGFTMERWVDDLGGLIEQRLGEPAILFGHSMGTIVALKAWQAWPQLVRGLIFVGGLPQVRPLIRERLSQRLQWLEGVERLTGWGRRISPGVFSPTTFRDRPEVVSSFEQRFESQDVESYVRCTRILLDADATAIVPTVTPKTLVVAGADDQYAPPDLVTAFARTLPGAALEIMPGCGHLPFLERPQAFADVVKPFIRSC